MMTALPKIGDCHASHHERVGHVTSVIKALPTGSTALCQDFPPSALYAALSYIPEPNAVQSVAVAHAMAVPNSGWIARAWATRCHRIGAARSMAPLDGTPTAITTPATAAATAMRDLRCATLTPPRRTARRYQDRRRGPRAPRGSADSGVRRVARRGSTSHTTLEHVDASRPRSLVAQVSASGSSAQRRGRHCPRRERKVRQSVRLVAQLSNGRGHEVS